MARSDRLKALESAVKEYVKTERARIQNEISVLEAILKGRTGGAGIQSIAKARVAAVAESDLQAFLASE